MESRSWASAPHYHPISALRPGMGPSWEVNRLLRDRGLGREWPAGAAHGPSRSGIPHSPPEKMARLPAGSRGVSRDGMYRQTDRSKWSSKNGATGDQPNRRSLGRRPAQFCPSFYQIRPSADKHWREGRSVGFARCEARARHDPPWNRRAHRQEIGFGSMSGSPSVSIDYREIPAYR
jgi:hypothetical protein